MQRLSVLFLASWWSFCAPGDAEGSGYQSEVEFALASCDSTRGSYAGTRVGANREAQGWVPWPSLRPWSRPGGSILCFPFQLTFYISFRLSALSQARKREAPAGRLHFRAGLRWEHRVTPLMKGRDGLARLQGGHLLLTNVSKQASGSWPKKKKKTRKSSS